MFTIITSTFNTISYHHLHFTFIVIITITITSITITITSITITITTTATATATTTLESTLSRLDLFIERLSGEVSHAHSSKTQSKQS